MSAVESASVNNSRRSTAAGNASNAAAAAAAASGGNVVFKQRARSSGSRSSSTDSSGILVAPAWPTSASPSATPNAAEMDGMETRSRVVARVDDNRLLVVQMKGYHNKQFFARLVEGRGGRRTSAVKSSNHQSTAGNAQSGGDASLDDKAVSSAGPNHRGTYSKQYILQHPEIEWVHRGQGRYLPLSEAQKTSTITKGSAKAVSQEMSQSLERKHSPATAVKDHNRSSHSTRLSLETPQQRGASTRHQGSESLVSPTSDQRQPRASRSARRTNKAVLSPESERRSSRVAAAQNLNYYVRDEDDEDDGEVDSDMEDTYNKDYVEAHPEEEFYHTGNGWYKKGRRPPTRRFAKSRDSEGHAVSRSADGAFTFDPEKTIHLQNLDAYPGIEFHHCGNGWYKPGPDATGKRNSTVFEPVGSNVEDEADNTVDRAYTRDHPEIEWVHRGNGRYRAKYTLGAQSQQQRTDVDQSLVSNSLADDELDEEEEEAPRRGSRPTRGAGQASAASGRRRVSLPVEDTQLFSKKYVREHPNERFHHRGQGRYARGPRPKPVVDDEPEESEGEEVDEALVDTEYVEAHPEDTFHHRGQGRWARGLPPIGASNKVAIRGPGAKDRLDQNRTAEEEDENYAGLPPPSALVLRSEGPAKWPNLKWHYRGGGKWARIAKHDWEALQDRTHSNKTRNRGLRNSNHEVHEQIGRELGQAEVAGGTRQRRKRNYVPDDQAGDSMDIDTDRRGTHSRRPPLDRSGYSGLGRRTQSKANSSEAPTPKPRVMTLEEDPLNEDDLPSLYKDSYSPSDSDADDEAGRLLQSTFAPMRGVQQLLEPLTKHDPRARPSENLHKLAAWTNSLLALMQEEYLESDKVTAPHARIPRKPAKGGRLPVDPQVFEDKKEADLYDYHYDARKLGHQDPDYQRIHRDAEGRALRGGGRRQRSSALQNNGTLPGWDFGDEKLGSKRAVKPVNRFDGIVEPPRKRARHLLAGNGTGTAASSRAVSMTPELRSTTPLGGPAAANREYVPQTKGRWAGHIPKRIQELRRESEGPAAPVSNNNSTANNSNTGISPSKDSSSNSGNKQREASPGTVARKGRPPGSKNLHKRRDAGIKKGPRKPKVVDDAGSAAAASSVASSELNHGSVHSGSNAGA